MLEVTQLQTVHRCQLIMETTTQTQLIIVLQQVMEQLDKSTIIIMDIQVQSTITHLNIMEVALEEVILVAVAEDMVEDELYFET